jgi:glycolate oxidase FAD binding subunit
MSAKTLKLPDPAAFALGGRLPSRIVTPASPEEVAETLRACDAAGEAVVAFGGGTLQGLGYAPARYDVALGLGALDRTLAYEYRDLTIAVEAGMTVGDLERTLAKNRQFVPLDAPRRATSTVGGTIASGWLGPRRATYGRPRDLLIGTTAVLADGTIAKAGGMVVKNSTGYDLSRLYAGSLGTLAVLVRTNFKTKPLPALQRVALAALPEATRERAVAHLLALEIEPAAALVIGGFAGEIDGHDGIDGRLLLYFEGSEHAVERATRDVRSALGAAGVPETTLVDRGAGEVLQRAIDAYIAPFGASVTYRIGGLPSDALHRERATGVLALRHTLAYESICDIRTGDLIARVVADDLTHLEAAIVPFDDALHDASPRATVISAPDRVRERLAVWGAAPPALAQMRALKQRFDPNGTLAPGRFVGGI